MKTFRKYFLWLVKLVEKVIRSGFNHDTGYFYYARIFNPLGTPVVGYVICRGYKIFWVSGYTMMDVATSEEDLKIKTEEYKKKGIDITGKWKQ